MKRIHWFYFAIYTIIFLSGIFALFHGFPDIERFFPEWMDERATLTQIMQFGTLDFTPKQIIHPPLYHYLTFIPISLFFVLGKLGGIFYDKFEFVRFYFNNTEYLFFIGRLVSFVFFWLTAFVIFKIARLFHGPRIAHLTTFVFLFIPRFVFDFSTTRPETLLFLNCSLAIYLFLRFTINNNYNCLFLSAFFIGVSTATKYNAIFLGAILFLWLALNFGVLKSQEGKVKLGVILLFKLVFFIFLGFFICDPFFVLDLRKYLPQLLLLNNVEMKYHWQNIYPAKFVITHLVNLISTIYLNLFGFIILCLGAFKLFKINKRIFICLFSTILIYEIYFGILRNNYSPLYFLNPLAPLALLTISFGFAYILERKKTLIYLAIPFFIILVLNYYDLLIGLSLRPTHLQKARAYIERNIPEYSVICLANDSNIPQLSITKESYERLMQTIPVKKSGNFDLSYKELNGAFEETRNKFKELRIESMTKKPQYSLLRLPSSINDLNAFYDFLRKNKISYIISCGKFNFEQMHNASRDLIILEKKFVPVNKRVYEEDGVFIYRVNFGKN